MHNDIVTVSGSAPFEGFVQSLVELLCIASVHQNKGDFLS
jgi:hypothetical protein